MAATKILTPSKKPEQKEMHFLLHDEGNLKFECNKIRPHGMKCIRKGKARLVSEGDTLLTKEDIETCGGTIFCTEHYALVKHDLKNLQIKIIEHE